jgi:hypothetical protein
MNVKHNGNNSTHWSEKEKNLNGLTIRQSVLTGLYLEATRIQAALGSF